MSDERTPGLRHPVYIRCLRKGEYIAEAIGYHFDGYGTTHADALNDLLRQISELPLRPVPRDQHKGIRFELALDKRYAEIDMLSHRAGLTPRGCELGIEAFSQPASAQPERIVLSVPLGNGKFTCAELDRHDSIFSYAGGGGEFDSIVDIIDYYRDLRRLPPKPKA
jgi:hypothetical protein